MQYLEQSTKRIIGGIPAGPRRSCSPRRRREAGPAKTIVIAKQSGALRGRWRELAKLKIIVVVVHGKCLLGVGRDGEEAGVQGLRGS